MATNQFIAARLAATPEGTAVVEVLAVGRGRGAATRVALEHCDRHGQVAFVGSPRLRGLDVCLPATVDALRVASVPELALRIGQWLTAIRACGDLRLGELVAAGDRQALPGEWLDDPAVLAGLGILLTPAPTRSDPDAAGLDEWLDEAPDGSIASLLRANGHVDDFAWWLEGVPASSRALLRVPLYQVAARADGGLRLGLWMRHASADPFVVGEALVLDVSADGDLQPRLQALRRDRHWSLEGVPAAALDRAWEFRGDPRLDRLFRRLPVVTEAVLLEAAVAAIVAGRRPAEACHPLPAFRRCLTRLLGSAATLITARMLDSLGLVGLPAPRLSHARLLHANGEPVHVARRRQAVGLWPALAADFINGQAARAVSAIDHGRPLVPALAGDYGVSAWTIRRLLPLLGSLDEAHSNVCGGTRGLAGLIAAAGPQAPALTPADLGTVSHWLRLLPPADGDWWAQALLRMLGAEAACGGWSAVSAMLERPRIGDEGMALLAWWDDLRENVRDVLARSRGALPDDSTLDATFVAWTRHLRAADALRFAVGWRDLLWGGSAEATAHDDGARLNREVEAVIGTLSLVHSHVEVTPLTTADALRIEGEAQQHCVGSYWRAVAFHQRLICGLRCPETGDRATVAWTWRADSGWMRDEAKGLRNADIAPGVRLELAIDELAQLIGDETRLSSAAFSRHRIAAATVDRDPANRLINGACLVSCLPPNLVREAMRWMPGTGTIDQQVQHAAKNIPLCHDELSACHD